MIKENTLGKFIANFIEVVKEIKEDLKVYLPDILVRYGKNILIVIKYGLILCFVLLFIGIVCFSGIGTILLIPSLLSNPPFFHWFFAVSPIIFILCVAGMLTRGEDD